MSLMKYDAMNLGTGELGYGMDFLQEESSNIAFPFLSTNLTTENNPSFLKKVIIKEVGNAKVAILGVMPDKDLPDKDVLKTRLDLENKENQKVLCPEVGNAKVAILDVMPDKDVLKTRLDLENKENKKVLCPIKAVKERISDLSKISDFIILLSQLPQNQLNELLNEVKGIDLAISCQHANTEALHTQKIIPSVKIKPGGLELGYIKIEKEKKGAAKIIQEKKITLDKSVPRDKEFMDVINKLHRGKIKEERILKQRRKIEKETKELLKLTPGEYLEQLQKTEKDGGGRP